jgi:glucosylceramidase
VSTDGAAWTTVATGEGYGGTTVIPFKPARAKFIKITQTAAAGDAPAWSIQRLRLYQPPKAASTP